MIYEAVTLTHHVQCKGVSSPEVSLMEALLCSEAVEKGLRNKAGLGQV